MAVGSEFTAESLKDPSEDDTLGWTLAGLHTSSALQQNYEVELCWSAGTYNHTRGFFLGSHPSSLSAAVAE